MKSLGGFNAGHYLDIRDATVTSVAEIGHGPHLVSIPPDAIYTGYDAYDPDRKPHKIEDAVQRISQSNPNGNITFERVEPGEMPRATRQFQEVVASNVVGDPKIAHKRDLAQYILAAAAQMATPEGVIVIRETFSPHLAFMGRLGYLKIHFSNILENQYQKRRARILDAAGLTILAEVSAPNDTDLWEQLEATYNPDRVKHPSPLKNRFYLFLGKVARD